MKKLTLAFMIFLITFLFLLNLNSCSNANRGTILQEGKITTIDPVLHKVYVEVPIGLRPYVIMGEVNSGTAYLKNGYPARLSDFSEEEPVLVQWRYTKNRQIIVMIEAKKHAYKYGRLRDGSHLQP